MDKLNTQKRFQDQNYRLSNFELEVDVVCPRCEKQALTRLIDKQARLNCTHCGFNKSVSTLVKISNNQIAEVKQAAHLYFDAKLWFSHPFKGDVFWAYNLAHLRYLQAYISAKLREHKDRTHFTLLEKLPKFYHEQKNREDLLKIIDKLMHK